MYSILLLLLVTFASTTLATSASRPNFLLLFPDQWRSDWTPDNTNLSSVLPMPTYSSLRSRGTKFTHAFVPSPLCAPSRACLAGGREYDAAGVPDNFSNDYPINQTTFYTLLREAGYTVMTSGKDDLTKATGPSLNGSFHASSLGFTSYARCDGKEDAAGAVPHEPYSEYCSLHSEIVNGTNLTFLEIYNTDMKSCKGDGTVANGYDCQIPTPLPQSAYEDDWVATNAISLLQNKTQGIPFFLQVSFPGPHPPFVVTSSMASTTNTNTYPAPVDMGALSPSIAQIIRRDYAAELINLDSLFAKVIAAIPAEDIDNTVIIIASDHGEMLGDHDDWGKTMPWQGSVNVPLVILGPNLPVKATIEQPVATFDIAGTILDLAGIPPALGMTTVSLLPLLGGSGTYRTFVSSGLSNWRAVSMTRPDTTRLKLICCKGACPGQPRNDSTIFIGDSGGDDEDRYPAVLDNNNHGVAVKFESAAANTVLLFDLDADPFDMDNLVIARPTATEAMKLLLPKGWCGAR
jgi:arylsulfatase